MTIDQATTLIIIASVFAFFVGLLVGYRMCGKDTMRWITAWKKDLS